MNISIPKFNIQTFKSSQVRYSYSTDEDLKNSIKNETRTKDSFIKQLNTTENRKKVADELLPLYIDTATKLVEELSKEYPDVDKDDILQNSLCYLYEYLCSESSKVSLSSIYNKLRSTIMHQIIKEESILQSTEPLKNVDDNYKSNDIVDVVMVRDNLFDKVGKLINLTPRQKVYIDEYVKNEGNNSEIAKSMNCHKSNSEQISKLIFRKLRLFSRAQQLKPYLEAYESIDKEVENFVLPLKK